MSTGRARAAARRNTGSDLGARVLVAIPAIAVASFFTDGVLLLGLGSAQIVLLALTIVAAVLTVLPGRATRLQGGVHLVIFAAFIVLSVSP